MFILPVIDLQAGCVVRGVGGHRHAYRPVQSCLTDESTPAAVAAAFVQQLGLRRAYVADLDAIQSGQPQPAAYQQIVQQGMALWLDAGVADCQHARRLFELVEGLDVLIVGLESLRQQQELKRMLRQWGPRRVALSLDLIDGVPLTQAAGWQGCSAEQIADEAIGLGVERLILLDLRRVGQGQGTGTGSLRRHLHRAYPHVQLIAGGGVRSVATLRQLAAEGCAGVLLASALHDATFSAQDLRCVAPSG